MVMTNTQGLTNIKLIFYYHYYLTLYADLNNNPILKKSFSVFLLLYFFKFSFVLVIFVRVFHLGKLNEKLKYCNRV